jgi:hypothetical protein
LEIALALVEEHHKEISDEPRRVMLNVFQLLPPRLRAVGGIPPEAVVGDLLRWASSRQVHSLTIN